jgi:hypothetical protein
MSVARSLRFVVLLSPALCLIGGVAWFILKPTPSPSPAGTADEPRTDGGKLVVLVVFDQMRGDYLDRWKQHFGGDGFEKLKRDGVWYSNAHLPYAASSTGPGHASLATGAPPAVHGIIENRWFDRARGKVVYSATTEEGYDRVPSSTAAARERWPALAPVRVLAPTVGDALKEQSKGGRVFSLSLKDRAAVLMGGKEPNGVYCFDSAVGEFHTSSYYRASVPAWVDAFDRNRIAHRWSGKPWDRLKPPAIYNTLGRDDVAEESTFNHPSRVFPHAIPDVNARASSYFNALEYSPYGGELLWEFAKAAIEGEKLGRNGTTDLLCVSFSSNDHIGHAFGPDSHEVLDVTLRSDKLLGEMLAHLDEAVGKDRYAVVVTSDHGICPLTEVARMDHPEARRVDLNKDVLNGLDEHLDKVFGQRDGVPGQWVENGAKAKDCHPWVYLNRRAIEAMEKTYDEVEAAAANWLRERPVPVTVFTRTQLLAGQFKPEEQPFADMTRISFHPDRAGDLYLILPPYTLLGGPLGQGTDHGTPHEYDRHVPILASGAGVPKLGERKEPTSSLAVAPLVAYLLGVKPPATAKENIPVGIAK